MQDLKIMSKVRHLLGELESRERAVLLGIVTVVVLGGLVYSFMLGGELRFPDEKDYYAIAKNIAISSSYSSDGVHPTAYRPPGYPLLLAVFVLLGADVVLLRAVNFILLGGCVYLVTKILKTICSRKVALMGAFLTLAYPVFFYTAGTLYPQTLASLLFLLFLSLVLRDRLSVRDIALAGFVMGCLLLTVPTFVFVLVSAVIYLGLYQKRIGKSFLLLGIASLVVLPWMVRNYAVFNSFVAFTTNSGIQLYLANSPESSASASVASMDLSRCPCGVLGLKEVELDSCYRSEAIKFIRDNKLHSLKLYFLRILNYFNFRNELVTKKEAAFWKDLVMLFTYGPFLAILILCLLYYGRYLRPNRNVVFLLLLYFVNPFFQAIFLTRIRYRLPFDFLLIALDVAMLTHVLSRYRQHHAEGQPLREGRAG